MLAQGYAYASTDKGNSGPMLYTDGQEPGDAIAEWHSRVTELTIAAKDVLAQRYHREPRRTYIAGFSAAGYLARWQLENRPGLYDGGIAWSGVLMTPERNLLTYPPHRPASLPPVRRHRVARGAPGTPRRRLPERFRADLGVQLPRLLGPLPADPARGARPHLRRRHPGRPSLLRSGTVDCDADYDLASRPPEVTDAIERISLTGRIGKPLLQLQGTLDTAVTPRDSRLYATMIANQGRGAMTRLYEIEGGSHFEDLYGQHPDLLRPMLPCFRDAFEVARAVDPERHRRRRPVTSSTRRVGRSGQHLRPEGRV